MMFLKFFVLFAALVGIALCNSNSSDEEFPFSFPYTVESEHIARLSQLQVSPELRTNVKQHIHDIKADVLARADVEGVAPLTSLLSLLRNVK